MENSLLLNVKGLTKQRESILVLVIVFASLLVSLLTPYFFTSANILAMLMGLTVEGVLCIGMVVLLITGGMDLSVGSVMALTGVVVGMFLKTGMPVGLAILLAMGIAVLIGVINGILIAQFGLNPFITTLGMMMAVRGLMLIISKGRAVLDLPENFKIIGQGSLFNIQFPILMFIILVLIFDLLMRKTRFMRQSYYIGGNETSAILNGIDVRKIKIFNYSLASFFAGLSGVIITARFGASSVTLGENTALNVITACIIGGASLNGGEGTVLGAVMGATFMQILSTSLNLLDVNIYWQNFITGVILILAILVDSINEKRKNGNKAI